MPTNATVIQRTVVSAGSALGSAVLCTPLQSTRDSDSDSTTHTGCGDGDGDNTTHTGCRDGDGDSTTHTGCEDGDGDNKTHTQAVGMVAVTTPHTQAVVGQVGQSDLELSLEHSMKRNSLKSLDVGEGTKSQRS